MSVEKLIESVTPEIYQRMQTAIETGKWPNGVEVTPEQRENCLQLVIAYDNLHKDTEERVGYLPKKTKDSPERKETETRPLTILKE